MKERIQEASKPDAPCSVFDGMVGRELHHQKKHHYINVTNDNIILTAVIALLLVKMTL